MQSKTSQFSAKKSDIRLTETFAISCALQIFRIIFFLIIALQMSVLKMFDRCPLNSIFAASQASDSLTLTFTVGESGRIGHLASENG